MKPKVICEVPIGPPALPRSVDHFLGMFHPDLCRPPGLLPWADPDGNLDPFCLGAVIGRLTTIPFGVAVTDSIRRRSADVARTALTLQHLCQGGFNLGVGAGEAMNLVPFGYSFETPVARCEAFLRELRALLDTGRMADGGVGRLGLPLESGNGPPRVWVAGHGPRMLRLAGALLR